LESDVSPFFLFLFLRAYLLSPQWPPRMSHTERVANIPFLVCLGGPTAAVIAFQNPHIRVVVVDRDPVRIRRWNSRHPPIYEPGLADIVRIARDGSRECSVDDAEKKTIPSRTPNLIFSTEISRYIGEADIVLIAVNTPTKYRGAGAGSATDMTAFEAVTGEVAQHARPGAIIVEKSTVPCRTAQLMQETVSCPTPNG
jgi:UDPglucose 6-dehydrogenase